MSIPKEDERTPGPSMRNQVADQCKVVAALADIVAKVNTDYERLLRDPESGPKMEDILDIVGNRTAQLMEYLGDVLNGMDACDEEDEWMTPIFQGAHKMFPVGPETGSFNSLREALANWDAEDLKILHRMIPDLDAVITHNPVAQVYFRAGLLACRETMARFVEQGGNPEIAASIRANWWPSLGDDPGAPRQLAYEEVADEQPSGRIEHANTSPSVEALARAWHFLETREDARAALNGVTQPACDADITADPVAVDRICPGCKTEVAMWPYPYMLTGEGERWHLFCYHIKADATWCRVDTDGSVRHITEAEAAEHRAWAAKTYENPLKDQPASEAGKLSTDTEVR